MSLSPTGLLVRPGHKAETSLRRSRRRRARPAAPWVFVLPGLAIYAFVLLYPSAAGAVYAFTDWNGLNPDYAFVGLDNFRRLAADEQAVSSIRNTLLLTAAVAVGQNVLGLALALGLNANLRSRNVLRTVFFAPVVLSPLVLSYLWQYVYSNDGALNLLLDGVGLDALQSHWLGDPSLALWSIAVTVIWQTVGISMVIFLAALQNVPDELLEAASLDGAGAIRRFRHIMWPLIAPATTVCLVLSVVGGFKLFDQILAMTGGGPGYATETLATVIYKKAFSLGEMSYSTAIALVLTLGIFIVAITQLAILRRRELT